MATVANLGLMTAFNVISQEFLDLYVKQLLRLDLYTKDFRQDVAVAGASVTTHVPRELSASTKSISGNYTESPFTYDSFQINLNQQYYSEVILSEHDLIVSPVKDLQEKVVSPMVYALGKAVEDLILSQITSGAFSNSVVITGASACTPAAIASVKAQARKIGWHDGKQQTLVINSDYMANLFSSAAVVQNFGSLKDVLVEGTFSKFLGFDVGISDRVPTAQNLIGFACRKQGLLIAMRQLPAITDFYGFSKNIVDPDTGATARLLMFYDPTAGGYRIRAETLVGALAGPASSLIRITTA